MNDANAVGLKINTDTKETKSRLNDLINQLNKTNNMLSRVAENIGFGNTNKQLKEINDTLSKTNNSLKLPSLSSLISTTKKASTATSNMVDVSAEYLENLNLMQVAYGDTREEAENFIDTLSRVYGLDESGLTRMLGLYRQFGNALAIDNEHAELLSSNLLKMQLDVASLYNLSFERAGTVLQASMAGQTKPVRGATGGDITQATLQTDLDRLGINRQVADLNRGEKAILIYLSLERQLATSQQDLTKTIDSLSNQQKIFSEQTQRLSRAIGNALTPAFTTLLTYANGLLMVTTELINAFAIFVGFEIPEYDESSYKKVADLSDYFDDATDSVGNYKKEVLGLRSFDKLNVISTPKDTSSSGVNSSIGAIDSRLLDSLKEYDLGLDSVSNKATKIRDSIMEWLGFTKEVDETTGKITWNYQGWKTTLKNVVDSFLDLSTTGKVLVGLGLVTGIVKFWNAGKKVVSLLTGATGLNKLFKNTGTILKPLGSMLKDDLAGGWYKLGSSMKDSVDLWSKNLTGAQKFNTSLVGAGGLILSFSLVSDAAKEFNKTGEYTTTVLGNLAGGLLGGTLSGALVGATWGGATGAIIGAFSGLAIEVGGYISQLKTDQDKYTESIMNTTDEVNKASEEYRKFYEQVDANTEKQLKSLDTDKLYLEQLKNITDENGKIKKGYEDRANVILTKLNDAYGTEYELSGNVITNNGKVIKSYEEIEDSIDKLIEKKKAEILLEAQKEKYAYAIEHQQEAYENYQKALDNFNKSHENYQELQKKYNEAYLEALDKGYSKIQASEIAYSKYGKALDKARDAASDAAEAFTKAKKDWHDNTKAIAKYDQLMEAVLSGDQEKIRKAIEETTKVEGLSYKERIEMAKTFGSDYANVIGEVNDTTYSLLDATAKSLREQSKTIEDLTPDVVEGWRTLATESKEKFLENINNLDENVRNELIGRMQKAGYDISVDFNTGAVTGVEKTGNSIIKTVATGLKNGIENSNFTQIANIFKTSLSGYLTDSKTGDLNKVGKSILSAITGGMEPDNKTLAKFATSFKNKLGKAIGFDAKTGTINVMGFKIKSESLQELMNYVGFAEGGFPEEDGWFRASKGEYFGRFDDGTTYIANNKQITDGIRQSTFNGMMDAMAYASQQKQDVNVTIVAEDNDLLNGIKFKEKRRERQYGF